MAKTFQEQGLNVGIVTNDQAADLVDTHSLRAQGFDVGEVAGACFCCNFNELTDTASQLKEEHRPDVILAEPQALIGFAPLRVVEQTAGKPLPEGFRYTSDTNDWWLSRDELNRMVEEL